MLFAAALYLCIGIGINKYKYGMQGIEAIPNISFWRQLPGLVKDGVSFSASQTKAGVDFVQQKYLRK